MEETVRKWIEESKLEGLLETYRGSNRCGELAIYNGCVSFHFCDRGPPECSD